MLLLVRARRCLSPRLPICGRLAGVTKCPEVPFVCFAPLFLSLIMHSWNFFLVSRQTFSLEVITPVYDGGTLSTVTVPCESDDQKSEKICIFEVRAEDG